MNHSPGITAQLIYLKGVLMSESIAAQVTKLQKMTVFELRKEWERVFGEPTKQTHRSHLWKRLARKLQEDQLPKLTSIERAQIAHHQDMAERHSPNNVDPDKQKGRNKQGNKPPVRRTPPPGSIISKSYKDRELAVKVLKKGFEYDGQVFRSLSAIAREITGTTWNGFTFFGLNKGGPG